MLASAYGSGNYGACTYAEQCGKTGFFHNWGWLVFLIVFILSLLYLLAALLSKRRKKDKNAGAPPKP